MSQFSHAFLDHLIQSLLINVKFYLNKALLEIMENSVSTILFNFIEYLRQETYVNKFSDPH